MRTAKVCRVLSPNYLDVQFDLDFGITCRVCVTISGAKKPEKGTDEFDKIIHALILMLGGKDIFVEPTETEFPPNRQAFEGKVYRKGEIPDCTVEMGGEKYVDIKMYLDKIAPSYDIKTVKEDFRRVK